MRREEELLLLHTHTPPPTIATAPVIPAKGQAWMDRKGDENLRICNT